MAVGEILLLVFVFVIAGFLGVELISKVPSQLHTPLMSGMNALSGITVLGAIAVTAVEIKAYSSVLSVILGVIAVVLAVINVAAGFGVTARMLKMFKGEDK